MKEKLEILLGDDAFYDSSTKNIFKEAYLSKLNENLINYEINFTLETEPKKVIENAHKYQIVVTDLDYTGDGCGKQGYEIIEHVSNLNPKPLLILCTSSDNIIEINKMVRTKIDYHAGTGKGHKFEDLIEILTKHLKGGIKNE